MTVNFYITPDDPAVLIKAVNFISTADCEIKESTSLLNPTLIIKYSTWEGLVANNVNYCQIPKFGNRYYFLGDPVILTGGRVEIEASVDVLMSNEAELANCYCYIQRGGAPTEWEYYLPDNSIPVKTTERVINVPFDFTPFNITDISAVDGSVQQNYLLTVVGGEI